MSTGHQTGLEGEDAAAAYFEGLGFAVLDRRWKCPEGELDLVVANQALIVFVEVKARATAAAGHAALEGISQAPTRLLAAAEHWMAAHPEALQGRDMRFDVVLIVPSEPVAHIENALQ